MASDRDIEMRWRDALVASLLPAPGRGLPAAAELDLRSFWPRFEASAPLHLRVGFRVATVAISAALPRLLGFGGSLADLGEDEREAVLVRGHGMPGFSALLDVAKVVVCMAYFADPEVQATARSRS